MQFIADMADLETIASDVADLFPMGAAMSCMLGLELYSSLEELAGLPQTRTSYRPQMDPAERNRLFGGWKGAVTRVW